MNKEEPYRDQAEKLRQRIEKMNEPKVDASQLPPRSEIHRNKKKRTKLKVKYPLIRLLVLFFILLPLTIFSIYSYMGGKLFEAKKASVSSNKGYETINLEKSKKERSNQNKSKPKDKKSSSVQPNQEKSQGQQIGLTETEQGSVGTQTASEQAVKKTSSLQSAFSTNWNNQTNNVTFQNMISHKVLAKETLDSISKKYYHSSAGVEWIKRVNHLRNDRISAGQILTIPIND